ncbi:MAG: hypothetical protein EBZ67_11370, partial [Chitinophagia bacterium]|nr:hypothetical protein [Chitinophagia bacterium]
MVSESGEWELQIDFDTRFFDVPRIQSMAHAYRHITAQVLDSPHARLRDLSLMDAEWTARVIDWSRGQHTPLPEELLIHRVFQRVATRFPEAVSIEHEGLSMTYRSLDLHANRLAQDLVGSHGIRTGDRVAISLSPGISHVLSILAVLKAGAVFVPVDPSLPEARIRLMLGDVGAGYIISDEDPGIVGIHHIPLVWTECETEVSAPVVDIDSEAQAYCLFSSGSTGQPKAIAMPHRSFTCIFLNHLRLLGMTPEDRVLQRSSLSFLMSLAEIFHALFSGATLVIASQKERHDIGAFIRAKGITVAAMTPSLTSTIDASDLGSLRVLFQAGEAATASDVMRLSGKTRICNGYGSSEANTTAWVELTGLSDLTDPLPIGRPLDNVDNYILDPFGHPVPPYL